MNSTNKPALRRVTSDGEKFAKLPEQIAALIAQGKIDRAFDLCLVAQENADSLTTALATLKLQQTTEKIIKYERRHRDRLPIDLEIAATVRDLTKKIDEFVLRCRIEKVTGREVTGRRLKHWLKGLNPPEPDERKAINDLWKAFQ